MKIGLFDLGLYGAPVALAGIAYVLLASPFLLPKGARRIGSGPRDQRRGEDEEDLLVGARVEGWSPAVGHTVAASGLRGLPGLYLVSVRRNQALLRAIGPEFILNQGDILYFTGMIESLGKVCAEYGLMAITQEYDETKTKARERRRLTAVTRRTSSPCTRRAALRIYKSSRARTPFTKNRKVEFMPCGSVDKRLDLADRTDRIKTRATLGARSR